MATGSGAGLISGGNSGGATLLTTSGASGDSGVQLNECAGFTKWSIQLIGTFTGQSVQIFGTQDPLAKYQSANSFFGPITTYVPHGTTIPLTSWFPLDAPATAAGTESNPLTSSGQSLNHSGPLVAIRAVSTGTAQTGTCSVICTATP